MLDTTMHAAMGLEKRNKNWGCGEVMRINEPCGADCDTVCQGLLQESVLQRAATDWCQCSFSERTDNATNKINITLSSWP